MSAPKAAVEEDMPPCFDIVLESSVRHLVLERSAATAHDLPKAQGHNLELFINSPALATHVLVVNGQDIWFIHAPVLMRESEFFKRMLTGNFSEAESNVVNVVKVEVPFPCYAFKKVIGWCYSGAVSDKAIGADGFKIAANARFLACDTLFERVVDRLLALWDRLKFEEMAKDVSGLTVVEIGRAVIRKAPLDFKTRVTMLADIGDCLDCKESFASWHELIAEALKSESLRYYLAEDVVMKLLVRSRARDVFRKLHLSFWNSLRQLGWDKTHLVDIMDTICDEDLEGFLPTPGKNVVAVATIKEADMAVKDLHVTVGGYVWYEFTKCFNNFKRTTGFLIKVIVDLLAILSRAVRPFLWMRAFTYVSQITAKSKVR
ncbi:hypothetical protein HK101_006172 [Irineochytrium annulatum]|nr:hypothetical protein HK101_006172 [Irineochytrium annulatum]